MRVRNLVKATFIVASLVVTGAGLYTASNQYNLFDTKQSFIHTAEQSTVVIDAIETDGTSIGTGFIVSNQGYIVTADHVIKDSNKLFVTLKDGNVIPAALVGRDEKTDVAVILVNKQAIAKFPALQWGDASKLVTGDPVVVIGNPFGVNFSVSSGIVSAIHRTLGSSDKKIEDFVQYDAATNPGNSGGEVLNKNNKVIGIADEIVTGGNTSLFGGSTPQNSGVSVAISSTLAKKVSDDIIMYGEAKPGILRITIKDNDIKIDDKAPPMKAGAKIMAIDKDSNLEIVGIKVDDVITSFNGKEIKTANQLGVARYLTHPGDIIKINVMRGKDLLKFDVPMGGDVPPAKASRPLPEIPSPMVTFTPPSPKG